MARKKTTAMRELVERAEIVVRPAVAIPIQAQIVEALGFESLGISGANAASHLLGLPDAGLITATEMIQNIQNVARSVSIPVMADCDTGFGNAINVRRTVESVVYAGAGGLFIEDQVAPKRCGFVKGKMLISVEEAVGKYRAAVDAKNEIDPDFVIMARTDARTAVGGGIDEVIKRARAYKEAGVDIIYVEALQSREEIKQVREAIQGPLACSPQAIKPYPTLQELQDLGMCMTLGVMFFKAGLVAMWDLLVDMKARGMDPWNEFLERTREHPIGSYGPFDLTGFPKIVEWEKKYLEPELLEKYDKSMGLYDPRVGHHAAVRRDK